MHPLSKVTYNKQETVRRLFKNIEVAMATKFLLPAATFVIFVTLRHLRATGVCLLNEFLLAAPVLSDLVYSFASYCLKVSEQTSDFCKPTSILPSLSSARLHQ